MEIVRSVLFLIILKSALSASILGVFPHFGKSHFLVFQPLMEELARKGHQVTVFSYFPRKTPLKNYKDIPIPVSKLKTVGFINMELLFKNNNTNSVFNNLFQLSDLREPNEEVVSLKEVKMLEKQKFDLSIIELFDTDLFYGLLYKIGAPIIGISSHDVIPWHNTLFRNPAPISTVPALFSPYSDRMSFNERFENMKNFIVAEIYHRFIFVPEDQDLAQKHFGDIPHIKDIARNTSILMINTHFSIFRSRPYLPSIVEIGGIHVQNPKPVAKDLQKVLDDSKGVVYFSMGSVLKGDSLSEKKQKAFIKVFSELKQTVLWKRETPLNPNISNIVTDGWYPQRDILAHPKVELFISHGGLLGTNEAVASGVPLVVIPMFGDQHHNAKALESIGIAVSLDFSELNEDNIRKAVNKVLNDPSYKQNAKKVKDAFLDRPMSPLDTAVYWVEYVIRHKGAPHLRSAAVDLTWYEYHNLDVYAAIVLTIYLIYVTIKIVLKVLFKLFRSVCCGGKRTKEKKH